MTPNIDDNSLIKKSEIPVYVKLFMNETYFENTLAMNYILFCKVSDMKEKKKEENKDFIFNQETKNEKIEENLKKGIDLEKEL